MEKTGCGLSERDIRELESSPRESWGSVEYKLDGIDPNVYYDDHEQKTCFEGPLELFLQAFIEAEEEVRNSPIFKTFSDADIADLSFTKQCMLEVIKEQEEKAAATKASPKLTLDMITAKMREKMQEND